MSKVKLTNQFDRDIILVNIGDGDRAFVGTLIKRIDSCQPAVIAIDAFFDGEKDKELDSILTAALRSTKNDLLIYSIDPATGKRSATSHPKFASLATEARTGYGTSRGLITSMIPLKKINDKVHELLPLKIVKIWKTGFRHNIEVDEKIGINYTRMLEAYLHFDGTIFDEVDRETLKGKMIILGYIGPTNENKFSTPIRHVVDYPENEPDTYGSVILANAIRTILEHEVKQ